MTNVIPIRLVCAACGTINRVPPQRLTDHPLCGKCRHNLVDDQPIHADDRNFNKFIEKSDLPVIVDFWAPWCGPCRQFAPVFGETAKEMAPRAAFIKLDTQANPHTAERYQIRSIPTLMLFHRGREIDRLSGALPKAQFRQWLFQHLAGLEI